MTITSSVSARGVNASSVRIDRATARPMSGSPIKRDHTVGLEVEVELASVVGLPERHEKRCGTDRGGISISLGCG